MITFEQWAAEQLRKAEPCLMNGQVRCVPSPGEIICKNCMENDLEERDDIPPPGSVFV